MGQAYDPMIYDVMREAANLLVGKYMYLMDKSDDEAQRKTLLDDAIAVRRWVRSIDIDSEQAVIEATKQLQARYDEQTVLPQAVQSASQAGRSSGKTSKQQTICA